MLLKLFHRSVALALALTFGATGCIGELGGGDPNQKGSSKAFSTNGLVGEALQQAVLERAEGIAPQNRPYQYDGVQDCWGYVRQVWNAILSDGSTHAEDYYPNSYNRRRWHNVAEGLPTGDAPSPNWAYFSRESELLPGDVLGTAQGHAWGTTDPNWHGGIYAGNSMQWDATRDSVGSGAFKRRLYGGFHYYYKPTHDLLAQQSQPAPQPEPSPQTANSSWHSIVARHSGKCLDVAMGGTGDGVTVWQYACNGTDAQAWKLVDAGDGYHNLVAKVSDKCLDVNGGSDADGVKLWQYGCNGTDAQKFKLNDLGNGQYNIVAKVSGKCVDVAGESNDDGADVIQWPCHSNNNQQWSLQQAGGGGGQQPSGGGQSSVKCPPAGTSNYNPPSLGDLDGQACDYGCWGNGTRYNACAPGKWQFCLPWGVFAPCQNI